MTDLTELERLKAEMDAAWEVYIAAICAADAAEAAWVAARDAAREAGAAWAAEGEK